MYLFAARTLTCRGKVPHTWVLLASPTEPIRFCCVLMFDEQALNLFQCEHPPQGVQTTHAAICGKDGLLLPTHLGRLYYFRDSE